MPTLITFGSKKTTIKNASSSRIFRGTDTIIMKDLENNTAVFFLGSSNSYKKITKSKSVGGPSASCTNFKTLNLDNLFHCKRMQRNSSDQDLFEGSSLDYENGNVDCKSSRQSIGPEGNGLLRRRKSDVSYTTEATIELDIEDENSNYEEKEHSFLRFLMDSIRFPKRKPSYDAFASQLINCSYTDACRCLDCQSRYFECDDDEDDDYDLDLSSDYNDEFTNSYNEYLQQQQLAVVTERKEENANTKKPNANEPQPTANKIAVATDTVVYDMGDDVTMMAGTPVFLNYLLNHPISCTIM